MKKYLFLFAFLSGFCYNGFAMMQIVNVQNNTFSPSSFNILLGDSVKWVWVNGTHTTTSTTIPVGATSWTHDINSTSTSFIYIPNKVGTYNYQCNFHFSSGMIASFIVGCPTPTVTITNPVPILVCAGTSVLLNSLANGGAPFTYQWQMSTNGGGNWTNASGATNANYSVTPTSGSIQYRVIVINSCQNTGASQGISISIQTISIGVTPFQSTVCPGSCTTLVAAPTVGGTIAGVYTWSPVSSLNTTIGATVVACPTASTTYTVTFVSSIGCSGTANAFVGISLPVSIIGIASDYSICAGTTTQLNATGSGAISFSWSPATGLSSAVISNPLASPTATTIYTVTGTNQNGCTGSDTVRIVVGPGFQLSQTHVNATCGNATGSIDLTVIGSGVFTYHWSNNATTQDLINIPGGNYAVTVTSGAGCSNVLTIAVLNNGGPTLSMTLINASCGNNNGSINLTVSGGTPPYNYIWNNGAVTEDLNNLGVGTYTVSVTDFNGCSTVLTINITNTTAPTLSETHINASCGNATGSIDLSVIGGSAPYSYHWSIGATNQDLTGLSAGTYMVTVTDANNCTSAIYAIIANTGNISLAETHVNASCGNANGSINLSVTNGNAPFIYHWSNNATTEDLTGLAAGIYTVTVTSTVGCSGTLSVSITNTNAPVLTQTHTNATCGNANGSINLTVAPVGNYNYFWSNGATTEDLTGLLAGTYTVTVYSTGTQCSAILSVVLTNGNSGTLTETHVNVTCGLANGSINLTVTPAGSYNYIWTNGATTQDISNLIAGTYTVTVSNSTGCSNSLTVNLTGSNTGITLTQTHINANCNNPTGSINLTASPAANYNYNWSNGATTEDISNLAAGTYTVTVYNTPTGCFSILSVTITTTGTPVITALVNNASCGANNGFIQTAVSGGTAPYFYMWNTGATTPALTGLAPGTYSVTVYDQNQCSYSTTAIVGQNPPSTPVVSIQSGTASFCNGGNAVLVVAPLGISYQWTKNNVNIAGATNSTYTATVTGNFRCVVLYSCGNATSNSIQITKLATPTATITANGPITFCAGQNVTLTVNAQAGVTYQWRKGTTNISGATNTTYIATAQGNYRCLVTKTATGCTKLSNLINIIVNCKVEDASSPNTFKFYPNPFTATLTIQLNAVSTIAVYNVLGQKLIEVKNADGEINIGKELNAGMYILEVKVNDEVMSSQRIVKVE